MARRAIKPILDRNHKQFAYSAWLSMDEMLTYDDEEPFEQVNEVAMVLDAWALLVLPQEVTVPDADL